MTGTFSCHRFSCHLKTNPDDIHVFIFAPSRLCAFAQEPQSATNLPATSEALHQATARSGDPRRTSALLGLVLALGLVSRPRPPARPNVSYSGQPGDLWSSGGAVGRPAPNFEACFRLPG